MIRYGIMALLASMMLLLTHPGAALAIGGISISPAIKEVSLAENAPTAEFQITITNRNAVTQVVRLSGLDFGSLDESGGVAFLGRGTGDDTSYSLSSWMEFSTDTVVLEPGKAASVRVTITNRQDLAPGGHYGAVVVTPLNEDPSQNPNLVELVPSSGALVLLKKQGGERYDLRLDRTEIVFPSHAQLRFQNAGNVHVVPRGTVVITDPRGRVAARGIINPDSGFTLPETFRSYRVGLTAGSKLRLPGRYTAQVQYRYDGNDQAAEFRQSFWHWGMLPQAIALMALVIFLGAYVFRKKRRRRSS